MAANRKRATVPVPATPFWTSALACSNFFGLYCRPNTRPPSHHAPTLHPVQNPPAKKLRYDAYSINFEYAQTAQRGKGGEWGSKGVLAKNEKKKIENSENCLSLDKAEAELAHKRNVATECKLYWRQTAWRHRCCHAHPLTPNPVNQHPGIPAAFLCVAQLDVDSCDTQDKQKTRSRTTTTTTTTTRSDGVSMAGN